MRRMRRLAVAAAFVAAPALAQDAVEPAWTVFVDDDAACYAVSAPTGSVNTRNGEEVEVSRGVTRLVVAWRPAEGVEGQVSFTGGYPFDPESTVALEAGGQTFDLAVDGEWAWPSSEEADDVLISALRGIAEVDLVGVSARGTTTRDTFSMVGFGAAVDEAAQRCEG
ncbi:hypothetical protein GCM10011392_08770 [Wenxinia marina]|nr:hypothetical protein GCM10011392_08770 [Wenxinia marina]